MQPRQKWTLGTGLGVMLAGTLAFLLLDLTGIFSVSQTVFGGLIGLLSVAELALLSAAISLVFFAVLTAIVYVALPDILDYSADRLQEILANEAVLLRSGEKLEYIVFHVNGNVQYSHSRDDFTDEENKIDPEKIKQLLARYNRPLEKIDYLPVVSHHVRVIALATSGDGSWEHTLPSFHRHGGEIVKIRLNNVDYPPEQFIKNGKVDVERIRALVNFNSVESLSVVVRYSGNNNITLFLGNEAAVVHANTYGELKQYLSRYAPTLKSGNKCTVSLLKAEDETEQTGQELDFGEILLHDDQDTLDDISQGEPVVCFSLKS